MRFKSLGTRLASETDFSNKKIQPSDKNAKEKLKNLNSLYNRGNKLEICN